MRRQNPVVVSRCIVAVLLTNVIGCWGCGRGAHVEPSATSAPPPKTAIEPQAEASASRLSQRLNIPVKVCDSVQAATANADIIVTTTPSHKPLLLAEHVKAGQHITSMGSDAEHKNEIDPLIIAEKASYFCDRLSQVQALGELHHAIEQGMVESTASFPEIGQVIAQQTPGRVDTDQITLCVLTGTGIEDTAIATLAYRLCQQNQAGTVFNN